jgi:hypothetical protein
LAFLNCAIDWLPTIGSICHHTRDLALDLREQDWHLSSIMHTVVGQLTGDDLASRGLNGQMELAPGPAGATVLFRIPFTSPKQLQAGAVDHEMHGTLWNDLQRGASARSVPD